jgi:hypothetical protein
MLSDLANHGRLVDFAQDHREFIAAEARHRVVLPHRHREPLRRRLEQGGAGVMGKSGIVLFEIVEVDKKNG